MALRPTILEPSSRPLCYTIIVKTRADNQIIGACYNVPVAYHSLRMVHDGRIMTVEQTGGEGQDDVVPTVTFPLNTTMFLPTSDLHYFVGLTNCLPLMNSTQKKNEAEKNVNVELPSITFFEFQGKEKGPMLPEKELEYNRNEETNSEEDKKNQDSSNNPTNNKENKTSSETKAGGETKEDKLTTLAMQFMEVTGVIDLDLAQRFVADSKQDVDKAVMKYFSNTTFVPPPLPSTTSTTLDASAQWSCAVCTTKNGTHATKCSFCQTPKPLPLNEPLPLSLINSFLPLGTPQPLGDISQLFNIKDDDNTAGDGNDGNGGGGDTGEYIYGNNDDAQQTPRVRALRLLMRARIKEARKTKQQSNNEPETKMETVEAAAAGLVVQPEHLLQRGHWDMSYDTSSSSKVLSAVNEVGKQGEEQPGELIQMTTKGGRKGKGIALLNTKGDTWDISGYYYDISEQVPRIFTMSIKEEKRKDDAKKKTVTKEEADKKELSDLEKAMALSKLEAGVGVGEKKDDDDNNDKAAATSAKDEEETARKESMKDDEDDEPLYIDVLRIMLYKRNSLVELKGYRMEDADLFRWSNCTRVGAVGLHNGRDGLMNICFQNSVLQSLYQARTFRDTLIGMYEGKEQTSSALETREIQVTKTLSSIFGRIGCSSSRTMYTHDLQQALPKMEPEDFGSGKQQDANEFWNYLTRAIENAEMLTSGVSALIDDQFGSTITTLNRCRTCQSTKPGRDERCNEFAIPFPTRFQALTGLKVVHGKSADVNTPRGYERIGVDVNSGRSSGDYIFICVRRWKGEIPITDITVFETTPPEGYTVIDVNLNLGGSSTAKQVKLAYKQDPHDSPIMNIEILKGDDAQPSNDR